MRHRLLSVLTAALLLPLAGCSSAPVTVATCIDWVLFDSITDAVEESDAVAIGRIVDEAGSTTYSGMPATTWNVEVDDWVSGTGADEIVVTSLPRSCGDEGDTMADLQGEQVALFLRDDPSGWQIVTPWQGVAPVGPDGGLPDSWPEDLYD